MLTISVVIVLMFVLCIYALHLSAKSAHKYIEQLRNENAKLEYRITKLESDAEAITRELSRDNHG